MPAAATPCPSPPSGSSPIQQQRSHPCSFSAIGQPHPSFHPSTCPIHGRLPAASPLPQAPTRVFAILRASLPVGRPPERPTPATPCPAPSRPAFSRSRASALSSSHARGSTRGSAPSPLPHRTTSSCRQPAPLPVTRPAALAAAPRCLPLLHFLLPVPSLSSLPSLIHRNGGRHERDPMLYFDQIAPPSSAFAIRCRSSPDPAVPDSLNHAMPPKPHFKSRRHRLRPRGVLLLLRTPGRRSR